MRRVLFLLLAAFLALGISGSVAASNAMALGMTQSAIASATAPMDCEGGASDPCGGGMVSCALGCIWPSFDLPSAPLSDQLVAAIRSDAAFTPNLRVGTPLLPSLPPPRRFDIA